MVVFIQHINTTISTTTNGNIKIFLVGLGDMPGNDGGSPEGNYGQHDCRGDLQGQADLLDKVSADFDLLIYGPQQCCSFDLKFYLPGCLM